MPTDLSWISNRKYPDKWMRLKDIENILQEKEDDSWIRISTSERDFLETDFIIFIGWYNWTYKIYKKVLKNKMQDKLVYWMLEPEVVNKRHNREGAEKILRRFKYIMTWNHEILNLDRVFRQNIPYNWKDNVDADIYSDLVLERRTLLTNISGNKISDVKGELYSERERIIKWFEKYHPDKFIFYGNGWDRNKYRTYDGNCGEKKAVYQNFKFALSIENKSAKDLVSEKIIDCLTAGIIPIYMGAINIKDYIPGDCFIDYNQFNNVEELYLYLDNMDDIEYLNYINNIKKFILNTDEIAIFSAQKWVDNFESIINMDNKINKFKVSFKENVKLDIEQITLSIKLILHRLKEIIK